MLHDLPVAGNTCPPTIIHEAEAIRTAEAVMAAGLGNPDRVSTADIGVLASTLCGLHDIPFDYVLKLTDRIELFFKEGITPRALFKMGLFLHGSLNKIRGGHIPPGPDQATIPGDFWGTLQCTGMEPGKTVGLHKLWTARFLLMDTVLAGMEFDTSMPGGFVSGAIRAISKAARDKEACAPPYLYGMRFQAILGKAPRSGLRIKKIDLKDSMASRNSGIRRKRHDCPNAPCYACRKGTDQCKYAVKKVTVRKEKQ